MDVLAEEHRVIEKLVDVLEALGDRIAGGETALAKEARRVLSIAKDFADRCHHGKEEEVLVPRLLARGADADTMPLRRILGEHEVGRRLVATMEGDLARLAEGGGDAAEPFGRAARTYAEMLRDHIKLEETELKELIETHLTPEDDETIAEGYERVERTLFEEGHHERLHDETEELWRTYVDTASHPPS
jgi:hemerythrin-like domain-containing protein